MKLLATILMFMVALWFALAMLSLTFTILSSKVPLIFAGLPILGAVLVFYCLIHFINYLWRKPVNA